MIEIQMRRQSDILIHFQLKFWQNSSKQRAYVRSSGRQRNGERAVGRIQSRNASILALIWPAISTKQPSKGLVVCQRRSGMGHSRAAIRTGRGGCVFVDMSLTHLLGVSQVRKRGLYRDRTWINRRGVFSCQRAQSSVQHAVWRRARENHRVARWNERWGAVGSQTFG